MRFWSDLMPSRKDPDPSSYLQRICGFRKSRHSCDGLVYDHSTRRGAIVFGSTGSHYGMYRDDNQTDSRAEIWRVNLLISGLSVPARKALLFADRGNQGVLSDYVVSESPDGNQTRVELRLHVRQEHQVDHLRKQSLGW